MNEKLQKKLSILESLIATQKDCVIAGYTETGYMHGMLNGLILSHALFTGTNPKYHTVSKRRKGPNKVRHGVRTRKKR